ncbi:MAG TPA: carbohydrate-binding protein, partial [Pedobacter sp.]
YVSSIESGEWLQYTVSVKESGVYTLKLGVASAQADGLLSLSVNGEMSAKGIAVPNTGGPADFREVELKNIRLNKGKQVLRVYADNGGFNFSSIQFIK